MLGRHSCCPKISKFEEQQNQRPSLSRIRQARRRWQRTFCLALSLGISQAAAAEVATEPTSLEAVLQSHELTILADVKHGVQERIAYFSSIALFETMKRAGVRHVAIEMPRALGRQAKSIDTEADVEAFAQDVILADRWHFIDPDRRDADPRETQYRVASAMGRQVLYAKRLGIDIVFYDFNNPLGGFRTYNDPVYRCLAELDGMAWLHYGLDGRVTKAERDAAIMRERFSHDDEAADYIEQEVRRNGGGKLVVIPGYAHAALPGGIADRLGHRLQTQAMVVAVFKDAREESEFHTFLWRQSRLLSVDLSRPPQFYFTIDGGELRKDDAPGRYAALDGSAERKSPSICYQFAHRY